jgi:hypothetical protein
MTMLPETVWELLETCEPECLKHEQVEMFQVEMDVTIVTRMLRFQ